MFIDGHVVDLKIHKVPNQSYSPVKFNVQPTERSKTGEGKDLYDDFVVLKVDGSISSRCILPTPRRVRVRHLLRVLSLFFKTKYI